MLSHQRVACSCKNDSECRGPTSKLLAVQLWLLLLLLLLLLLCGKLTFSLNL
jgi:hypothetical protein